MRQQHVLPCTPHANAPTCPCQARPPLFLAHAVPCPRAQIPGGSSSCLASRPTPAPRAAGQRVLTKALRYLCLAGAELQMGNRPRLQALASGAVSEPSRLQRGLSLPPGKRWERGPGSCGFVLVPAGSRSRSPSGLAQARFGSLLCLNRLLALLLAEENLLQPFKAPEKQEARWKTGDPGIYYFSQSHHFGPDSRLLNVWDGQPRGKVSLLSTNRAARQEGQTSVQ